MAEELATNTSADTAGMATVVYGDALAVGEETLTWVDAVQTMDDKGEVTIATGEVTATAAASGNDAFAYAMTEAVVEGADIVIMKAKNSSDGSGYDVSITKFKAIDVEHLDGVTKFICSNKTTYEAQATIDLDGNVAMASVDAETRGTDTFVGVDAYVLAIEDDLSQSTVVITSAVG